MRRVCSREQLGELLADAEARGLTAAPTPQGAISLAATQQLLRAEIENEGRIQRRHARYDTNGRKLMIGGLSMIGVGVVLAITGGAISVVAALDGAGKPDASASTNTAEAAGYTLLVVAAGTAGVGSILMISGGIVRANSRRKYGTTWVAPVWVTHGVGLGVGGRF